ncbi:DUF6585 family protein [Ktedonospora formicarum]|uniref:Uncharacterized protein n=1 Tax=Ktedonospora formicarum TaxID=2778364 RepID=A0A8J3MYQ1_9CHLR|nr:DUF6585 family protein [Ktedonospora formicarum]GHO51176.1 hypothetical protein KSX_93390 [Ktedonospora formicarum]
MEAVDPLSPRAYQVAAESGLGEPRAEFRTQNPADLPTLWLYLALGLLFVSLSWYDFQHETVSYAYALSVPLNDGIGVFALCFGSVLTLGSVLGIAIRCQRWLWGEVRLYVCDEGIVGANRKHLKDTVRLDEITEIRQAAVASRADRSGDGDAFPRLVSIFATRNGKEHSLADTEGALLVQLKTESVWPQVLARYQSGESLPFGRVSLAPDGIYIHKDVPTGRSTGHHWLTKMLIRRLDRQAILSGEGIEAGEHFVPWEAVEMPWIDMSHNVFIISRKEGQRPWAVLPWHHMTNAALCLKLCEQVLGMAEQEPVVGQQETSQPGTLVSSYGLRAKGREKGLFWFAVALYICLLGFGGTFLIGSNGSLYLPFLGITFVIIAFLSLPVILFGVLRDHKAAVTPLRRKVRVDVYEQGFRYREGREEQMVFWTEIESVQRQATSTGQKKFPIYTIRLVNGRSMTLSPIIGDIDTLGEHIAEEVTKRLYSRALADLQVGKLLVFAGLAVSRDGLSTRDSQIGWQWIERVTLDLETLRIQAKGTSQAWARFPTSQIPNSGLLLKLVQHIKEEQGLAIGLEA